MTTVEAETVAEWTHSGVRCKVVKTQLGNYCGYVRTMFDETWSYDDFQHYGHGFISVHGGLTYGVDQDGWVGFDCAHAGDVCLDEDGNVLNDLAMSSTKEWRVSDVREETEELAEQFEVVQEFAQAVLDWGDLDD